MSKSIPRSREKEKKAEMANSPDIQGMTSFSPPPFQLKADNPVPIQMKKEKKDNGSWNWNGALMGASLGSISPLVGIGGMIGGYLGGKNINEDKKQTQVDNAKNEIEQAETIEESTDEGLDFDQIREICEQIPTGQEALARMEEYGIEVEFQAGGGSYYTAVGKKKWSSIQIIPRGGPLWHLCMR